MLYPYLQVILSDFLSEGPLSVVEVQVESVSMSAVCGLHHAVLRRVQVRIRMKNLLVVKIKPTHTVNVMSHAFRHF